MSDSNTTEIPKLSRLMFIANACWCVFALVCVLLVSYGVLTLSRNICLALLASAVIVAICGLFNAQE